MTVADQSEAREIDLIENTPVDGVGIIESTGGDGMNVLRSSQLLLGNLLTLGLALSLSGCGPSSAPHKLDPKDDPNVYCAPGFKEAGEVVHYNDDGTMKRAVQFFEYETAANFTMRIPNGVGGLGHPNKKCAMEEGEFEFRWVDGKLQPYFDYKTGKSNNAGSWVKYFVTFSPPSDNPVRKFEYPKWMFEGAFRIPGHEKILVLPFAEFGDPKHIPADRKNLALWRPKLLLEDARDLAGNPITFFCASGLSYQEKGGVLHVSITPRPGKLHKCMANPAFVSGAGGRLDIYDEDFLGQGAAITNAVIQELNTYIIKQ